MSTEPQSPSRRRRRSIGARPEVRVWLSRDNYDRVARESSARRGTLSQSVRECLEEYFLLKQEIASALTPSPGDGATTGEGVRLAHALLGDQERRIVAEIERRDARLAAVLDQVRLVGCMVDQAYFDLVARLPEIDPALRSARAAAAEASTRAWRKYVREMHAAGDGGVGE